jgi:menaquinone-specific isochorismate synthase
MILPITDLKKALLSFLNEQDLSEKKEGMLINFAYKIEELDITSLIDLILRVSKKVFYFNRPEENFTLLAFEDTLSLKINGENKFSSLGDKISLIIQNSINNFDKTSSVKFPLFLGGTKFNTGKNTDEWIDFADNDWFIPQFLFYQKDKDFWFVLNFIVDVNYSIEDQINSLCKPIDKLLNENFELLKETAKLKFCPAEREGEKWNSLISDSISKIEEGLFRKVVISRRIIAEINQSPLFNHILEKLQDNYKNCTAFLYKSENSVLFGATPEQLLKFGGNEIEFDALAGSAKRGDTEEYDKEIACNLLNDIKNNEEHNHVIEFIKNSSSKYVKNFRQFPTVIKKFSNIQHIYTPIKAELKFREQIYKLVDDIFPTPAICGYPKELSFNYIIENENFDRGLFSGIIGFISQGEMDLVVAIRSALLNNNKLYIYAGCGIVKGSDPISEFEETEIKMKPILSLFKNES